MKHEVEVAEPRNAHVNVVEFRSRRRINPRHPSLQPPTVDMFDQDDPDIAAADRCVVLTKVEASHIATLLNVARAHLPSPRSCDEAIRLLGGKR